MEPALRRGGFDAVLMIGVAGRAKGIRIERRALNGARILLPDVAKRYPAARLGPGPAERRSGVGMLRVRTLLRRSGLPAAISQDAGGYLCNGAYYTALGQDLPVLFLHIPKMPRGRRRTAGVRKLRQRLEERMISAFGDVGLSLVAEGRRR